MTNWYDSIVTALKNSLEAVFVKKSSTTGLLKNDGTVDTSSYITSSAISGKIDTAGTGLTKSGTTLSADIGNSSNTSSSKLVACNDSRLSDARTPTAHNQALPTISDADTVEVLVTYTDDSTETLDLVVWVGATIVTNVVLTKSGNSHVVTVTNSKGDGISGKTVTLKTGNISIGSGTTNSNGVATITTSVPYDTAYAVCDGVQSNTVNW